MKWILILTIFGQWDTGSTVASVGPFTSEAQCLAAGNAWLKQRDRFAWDKDGNVRRFVRSALCVSDRPAQ